MILCIFHLTGHGFVRFCWRSNAIPVACHVQGKATTKPRGKTSRDRSAHVFSLYGLTTQPVPKISKYSHLISVKYAMCVNHGSWHVQSRLFISTTGHTTVITKTWRADWLSQVWATRGQFSSLFSGSSNKSTSEKIFRGIACGYLLWYQVLLVYKDI